MKSSLLFVLLFQVTFSYAQLSSPFELSNSATTDNFMKYIPKGIIVDGNHYVTGYLTLSDYQNLTSNTWVEFGDPHQKLQLRGGNIILFKANADINPTSQNGAILFSDFITSTYYHGKWGIEYDNKYSLGGLNFFNPMSELNAERRNFNLFINNAGLVGIGTGDPKAKLEVKDGDIFISDINNGIIMKSPDGNCWRGTVTNDGQLVFTQLGDCTSVDVKETDTQLNFRIYPNPANGFIELNTPSGKASSASIFTITGDLVKTFNVNSLVSRIDVSELKPGTYIVKVVSSESVSSETFIIN